MGSKLSPMEKIGEALYLRRLELKLSVKRAAELGNLNRSQINDMECGSSEYTMPVLMRYLNVLGLEITFKGENVMNKVLKKHADK